MELYEKLLLRIEDGKPIYDNVAFAKDLEKIAKEHNVLESAEQQLTGYSYGQTMNLSEVIVSMGLTLTEWNKIQRDFNLEYLSPDDFNTIDAMMNH